MNEKFDLYHWHRIKMTIKKKYPQLTDADLIWRHETKDEFFKTIAGKLGRTKNEFISEIEKL
jgi:hypothetical protein